MGVTGLLQYSRLRGDVVPCLRSWNSYVLCSVVLDDFHFTLFQVVLLFINLVSVNQSCHSLPYSTIYTSTCSTLQCFCTFLFNSFSSTWPFTPPPQPSFALPLPCLMQDWLWGTPITNSEGNKILFTTGCSRGYCHCQVWYADSKAECRFTVSQDLAQRERQCTCNRQG